MLDQILDFKADFLAAHQQNVTDIQSFIAELNSFQPNLFALTPDNSFWRNYFHAVLVSCYFESTDDYSLLKWNEYVSNCGALYCIEGAINESAVLELFVLHNVNHVFDFGPNSLQIKAFVGSNNANPNYLTDDSYLPDVLSDEENQRLISNLRTVMKIRGQEEKRIWGDNDVIVTLTHMGVRQQFCIISCKTSLRERVYQSIFWAMQSRMQGIGKHVFVTADKGSGGNSEIGHRDALNQARKSRDVLESTMDRVYVMRNQHEVNRSQVIKDFLYLQQDLDAWSREIAGV